jgi:beta-lactam-binding protein with PASTA domain
VVSKGPEIIYHPMVACKGSTVEQVQKFMDDLNFVAEFTKVEGVEPEGTVLTQSVDTGVEVAEGSTVTFTYSDGEKLIEKTVSYTVPASEGDVYVEMYLDDTRFFAGTLPGTVGTIQEKVFQKAGTYELRVYLNDVVDYYDVLTFSANG